MSAVTTPTPPQLCAHCPHAAHAQGVKCGVIKPNGKACKCKAQPGFFEGLGNAIGESLFGGNR
jgi:hypothetical protein